MQYIDLIWGVGANLSPVQMSVRALVIFLITLVLIRMGGMRIFGKKSALDNIIVIMLGAVLARVVVGASPFLATVSAAAVMIFTNRFLAWVSQHNVFLNNLIKGKEVILFESGEIQWENLKNTNLSLSDLLESLRLETNKHNFEDIENAYLETNGRISFTLKSKD